MHDPWKRPFKIGFKPLKVISLGFPAGLIGLGVMISGPLKAQNLTLEHWTVRDGLPASPITSVAQTQDGALWIGTRNGLARFDGAQFTVFTPQNLPGLRSVAIESVAAGPDSQLYLGTDSGLTVLSHGRARTFQERSGNVFDRVTMVLPVGSDNAWFGNQAGFLYHYNHGSVQEFGSDVLPRESVYGLAVTPDGKLWIATGGGLFFLSSGKLSRYQPALPLPVVSIFDLAVTPEGNLYAASDAGLLEIQGQRWKLLTKRNGLPTDALNILLVDPQGALWLGTQSGLAKLENGIVHPISSVKCDVRSLFADKEKDLWISCDDAGGLTRLTKPLFTLLPVPQPSGAAPVQSLAEDLAGAVWIGSSRGLFRYQNRRFKRYSRQDGLPSDQINSVSLSSTGTLWIATDKGLASLKNGRIETLKTKEGGVVNNFFRVLEDRQRTLWVTSELGLARRRLGESSFKTVPNVMNSISCLHEDRAGALWVSTYSQGLIRFASEIKTAFTAACGLGSDTVLDSVQDSAGTIWAWTNGGLSRIREGHCANIGPAQGLPRGKEGTMGLDHTGHLWLKTPDGIAAIDLAEANHVIDSGGSLRLTRFFGRDDGFGDALSDSQAGRPLALASGDLWIPTLAGMAVVNTAILKTPPPDLRPQVNTLVTDQGVRDLTSPIRLQPGDVHLQFSYSVPSLRGAGDREYRYRLTGFDKEWREGRTRREAVYTSLPTGTYHFQASARLSFGAWSEASAPIAVTVLPHFYQAWWWYTLLSLAGVTVIGIGYRLRLRAVRSQYAVIMAERIEERSRLARELHDTLSQGMMAIHAQIQLARALLRSEPVSALSHLDTAVTITRRSASETRRSIAALRSDSAETANLRDILEKAILSFKDSSQISLEAAIDDDLPRVTEEITHEIARVTEEALTNVRLHSEAEHACLFARSFEKKLQIGVTDNGKGFDLSAFRHTHNGHFGLTGMAERAQRIHGSLHTSSVQGEGTKVVLEIPLTKLLKRASKPSERSRIKPRLTGRHT